MGEEICLRSTSPPLADDYQEKAVTDYSLGPRNTDGPDSVRAVSYRPVDHTSISHISGLVPTTTGYVNGGPSINFRPKQSEPMEDGRGLGVLDFDTKCSDAYADLDDIRRYHFAPGPRAPSPERAIYKGVPNHHSKEQKKKSVFLVSFVAIVFVLELFILTLGIFNLVNGLEVGTLTKDLMSATSQPSTQELTDAVNSLREQVNKLQQNLNVYNSTNLAANNLTTSTAIPSTEPPSPNLVSISLHENCSTNMLTCTTDRVDTTNGSPSFTSCFTPSYAHDDSSTYVANLHCVVTDDNQILPLSSSLTFNEQEQEWKCRCQGIELANRITGQLKNFRCEFQIRTCPTTIQISLP